MIKEPKTPKNSDKKDVKKGDDKKKNKFSFNSLIHSLNESLPDMSLENDQDLEKESNFNSDFKKHQEDEEHSHTLLKNQSSVSTKHRDKAPDISKDENELSFLEHYKEINILKPLKKHKNKIIKLLALISSVFLILVGIILISNSVMRVSDNVIFGERAMFSVFLILIGFLVLSVVFAGKLLKGTFLKKIQNELKVTEGKSEEIENDPITGKDKGINKKD